MNRCVLWWSAEGHFRVSEVGVTIIQQFRHLVPFTHPLSSSPSADHDLSDLFSPFLKVGFKKFFDSHMYKYIGNLKVIKGNRLDTDCKNQ